LDSGGRVRMEGRTNQAEVYPGIVRASLDNAGCTAIPTWGFRDKDSWMGSRSRGAGGEALPFDRAYQPKAAYPAMLEEMLAGRPRGH